MRYFLAILLAACAATAAAEDQVARYGTNWVRFMEKPCTLPEVLAQVPPDKQSRIHSGVSRLEGVEYMFCWARIGPVLHLMYEDGDRGMVLESDLEAAISI